MMAAMIRRSSSSSRGISSTITPRDMTTTRSQMPGQLDRVAGLDEHGGAFGGPVAQGVVDVEAGTDVDALRRLVSEDHLQVAAQERPHQRHLLLVAA